MSVIQELFVEMQDGVKLYTCIFLPREHGSFPVVFIRNPYCTVTGDVRPHIDNNLESLLANGYAVVYQHCRGTGKSEGDCIPFINERSDGLQTLEWIRTQNFYPGEIYPFGGSYLTAVHLAYLDPVPKDVKGAILEIFDSNRYTAYYRNGFVRQSLTGWFAGMYKKNGEVGLHKSFVNPDSYRTMPLTDFSRTVFGEGVPAFDEMLRHPDPEDDFWKSADGGYESFNVMRNARIPILLTSSFYDLFADGVFKMWDSIPAENRENCALLVTPYNHGKAYQQNLTPLKFENGEFDEVCPHYVAEWLNHVRNNEPLKFIRKGEITYYTIFENKWRHEEFLSNGTEKVDFYLNNRSLDQVPKPADNITYVYNPYAPASFKGGICNDFDGMEVQDEPNSRYDIISFLSEPFEKEKLVKGKMSAELSVKSDCEDTCFYVRVSIVKDGIAYSLRDDITSICYQHKSYEPGTEAKLSFDFTPHAFLIEQGDRLRVDVSSSAFPHFSVHTNYKGLQSERKTAKTAHNSILCGKSRLTLWAEK